MKRLAKNVTYITVIILALAVPQVGLHFALVEAAQPTPQSVRLHAPFGLEAVRGRIDNYDCINKFGLNTDIDIAVEEAIWDGGGDYTGHDATAAETVEVFSSDAADDSAGTGARTLSVIGLDSSWVEQAETVTLDGVTAVDTANTYIRLFRVIVLTAGSGGSNAGTITVRQKTTTANVFCVVQIGYNQSMVAAYTVPANTNGYIFDWFMTIGGAILADCDMKLLARPTGGVFNVQEQFSLRGNGNSSSPRNFAIPKGPYAEKTDIQVRGVANANNTQLSAGFSVVLIDVI